MGWASKRNRELLALAVDRFEIFVTADRKLSHQQDLSAFDIAIVVLVAPAIVLRTCVYWCLHFSRFVRPLPVAP
ncbi:MAG TPA: hypothetical protein VFO14_25215 [Vicinamibacterales bacterium]|nr:hypothetical protein [Vicinamibacterales bacterium]